MAGSPNSQQNTSDNNSNLDQFLLKLEDLNTQIDEFQKELSQIQQNITQTILQRDKNVIEKFLSSKTFKFLPPELKVNLTLDKLLDYFKNLFSA
jgi:Mg2+ and Co2+ transporter CorA